MIRLIIIVLMTILWGYIFKNDSITDKYETGYTAVYALTLIAFLIF